MSDDDGYPIFRIIVVGIISGIVGVIITEITNIPCKECVVWGAIILGMILYFYWDSKY
jgi:hypothetical protein